MTQIVKPCGNSVVPSIDVVETECTHYHSTACVYSKENYNYISENGETQKDINKTIDNKLGDIFDKLSEHNSDIYGRNVRGYDDYSLTLTNSLDLFSKRIEIAKSNKNIIPKSISIYGLSDFLEKVELPSPIKLVVELNNETETVTTYNLKEFNIIKKILITEDIKIGNQWDKVTSIILRNVNGVVLEEFVKVEIRLNYNLED